MPANLPPEYFEAEKRFKEAQTYQEKIIALEGLIATVPKHKGTDKLRADLRRRLSRLREEAIKKKRGGKGSLYTIERHGAAQISLVGFANSGKSSILSVLTNARPVIADYPMSTVMPLSGMMPYEDIQFQLIDLPPIGNESTDGWVSSIIRMVNVIMLVIDLAEDPDVQVDLLIEELNKWRISISKDDDKAKSIIICANKIDLPHAMENMDILLQRFGDVYPIYGVSSIKKTGLEELRRGIFKASRIIRVYSKEPGKEPDMNTPFTLPIGSNILDLAGLIHKDFVKNFRYACIWGSARFDGQRVNKDYILHDGDIVEYHV
ncbi:MAG: 50S ribosome-binding GTPase [Thermodesulfovibrionia bacterium]